MPSAPTTERPFLPKPALEGTPMPVDFLFRSLAHLPGVANAKLFEPQPRTIYSWRLAA